MRSTEYTIEKALYICDMVKEYIITEKNEKLYTCNLKIGFCYDPYKHKGCDLKNE